jgi:hypothetical protein
LKGPWEAPRLGLPVDWISLTTACMDCRLHRQGHFQKGKAAAFGGFWTLVDTDSHLGAMVGILRHSVGHIRSWLVRLQHSSGLHGLLWEYFWGMLENILILYP